MRWLLCALAIGLTSCSDEAPEAQTTVTEQKVYGDHLNVEIEFAGEPSAPLDTIASNILDVRRAIAQGRIADAQQFKTASVGFWIIDSAGDRDPLAGLDYDRDGFMALTDRSDLADIFNAAREARARAPHGDLLIDNDCTSREWQVRQSQLCSDAANGS